MPCCLPASKITYTVSGGALNSTQSNLAPPPVKYATALHTHYGSQQSMYTSIFIDNNYTLFSCSHSMVQT